MAKTFILHDESLNAFGFWIKTSGLDWSLFDKNPIALFMHIRPGDYENKGKDMVLPIGIWENKKQNGSQVLADFNHDDTDEFAVRINKKVEKGIIRMASLAVEPTKWSDDPKDLKPGQTRPTVIAGIVKEASIVDIAGNRNAIRLYNSEGELILLSDDPAKCPIPMLNQKTDNKMTKINGVLKLKDDANEAEQYQAIVNMNNRISQLESEKKTLEDENIRLKDTQKSVLQNDIKNLIDGAVKERKILEGQRADYVALAEKDFDNTKKILDAMPVLTKLSDQAGKGEKKSKFEGKNWEQLDKAGLLEEFKLADPNSFKDMYKEKFGKEYRG